MLLWGLLGLLISVQFRGIDTAGQDASHFAQGDHALDTHRICLDDAERVGLLLREDALH